MSFGAQVLHVFRKDVRRFWPALLGVGALVAIHRLVGLPLPVHYDRTPIALSLSVFPAVFALLTVVVVQEDGVIGNRASWRATPLSWTALLTAKLAFIGLFCWAIPVVVHVQWIVALGGVGDTLGLLADSALYQGGFLMLVVVGACMTPNLETFLVVALAAWFTTGRLEALAYHPEADLWNKTLITRAYILRSVWLVVGLGLAIYQYRSARTARMVALAMAAFTASWISMYATSPDWIVDRLEPKSRFEYEGPEIDPRLISISRAARRSTEVDPEVRLDARLAFASEAAPVLRLQEGRVRLRGGGISYDGPMTPDRRAVIATVAHPPLVPGYTIVGQVQPTLRAISLRLAHETSTEIDALTAATRLELGFKLDAFRPRVVGKLPLEPGASVSIGGGIVTVRSVQRMSNGVSVDVAWRSAIRALSFERTGMAPWPILGGLVLVNPQRGEILLARQGGGGGDYASLGPSQYLVGGTRVFDGRASSVFGEASGPGEALPDGWYDDAELLLLDYEYEGTIDASLERDIERWPAEGGSVQVDPLSPRASGG